MDELTIDLPDPATRRDGLQQPHSQALLSRLRESHGSRIGAGRAGTRLTTATFLRLMADHAITQDALHSEVSTTLLQQLDLFGVDSAVSAGRVEYLLRPDLGRRFGPGAEQQLRELCLRGADLQIVAGDGLSARAIEANLPALLPAIAQEAKRAGLSLGTSFFVRNARVGLLNEVGRLLDALVVVLLIGERPGLGRAESLSAYLAYRPRPGDTDANRNVVSNICPNGGLEPTVAAVRIVELAQAMLTAECSGVRLGQYKRDTGTQ